MNEFTKEELELILSDLENKIIIHHGLEDKIRSMIDSYPKCDHRSGMGHYNEKGERVGFESDIFRCRHCDILFRFLYKNGSCIGHEELE